MQHATHSHVSHGYACNATLLGNCSGDPVGYGTEPQPKPKSNFVYNIFKYKICWQTSNNFIYFPDN